MREAGRPKVLEEHMSHHQPDRADAHTHHPVEGPAACVPALDQLSAAVYKTVPTAFYNLLAQSIALSTVRDDQRKV